VCILEAAGWALFAGGAGGDVLCVAGGCEGLACLLEVPEVMRWCCSVLRLWRLSPVSAVRNFHCGSFLVTVHHRVGGKLELQPSQGQVSSSCMLTLRSCSIVPPANQKEPLVPRAI
jgi:hypothetical protein